jgi:hypothetical protein
MVPYSADIDRTEQFERYINDTPYLFPLRHLASVAKKQINAMNRQQITRVVPNDTVYLDLRYYDGTDSAWFDSFDLPEKDKTYTVKVRALAWEDRNHKKLKTYSEVFNMDVFLATYDVYALIITQEDFDDEKHILVTNNMRLQYPKIFE